MTLWAVAHQAPLSPVHGIFLARILEWVAFSFSRGSSLPRDWTQVSCIAGRFFTHWATKEAAVPMALTVILDHFHSTFVSGLWVLMGFWGFQGSWMQNLPVWAAAGMWRLGPVGRVLHRHISLLKSSFLDVHNPRGHHVHGFIYGFVLFKKSLMQKTPSCIKRKDIIVGWASHWQLKSLSSHLIHIQICLMPFEWVMVSFSSSLKMKVIIQPN